MRLRRGLVLNCILLASCLFCLFLVPALAGPVRCRVGTEEEIRELKETHEKALEPFFTRLAFSGEALPMDRETSTFYLPLNMESEAWERGSLTSLDGEVDLIFEERFAASDKQEAVREGKCFRFYAVRGGEYQECFLTVTGLPMIAIETEETADTEVFGGTAYFWDNSQKKDWASSSILEAHIRGNTSRIYPKKGYRLSLKTQDRNGNIVPDKKSLFGLRRDDEWILNAMYSDSSKIRDKLSIDLWNSFGASVEEFPEAKFGTDFTYVEVLFNGRYWGLYGLLEPVDSKQLDLNREGGAGKAEYSYKSVYPQEIPSRELESLPEYTESVAGFELKGTHTDIGKESWEPLFSYLRLRDLSDDESFIREAPVLTDVDGALKVWIYLQAVLGIDNRGKNMYYVAKSRGNSYRIYFAPWDLDLTWGDAVSEGTGAYIWDVDLFTNLYSERINWSMGDRLIELDVEDSRRRAASMWRELRKGILSGEGLAQAVDGLVHQIRDSGALARNQERWPEDGPEEDYERFKRMALYRMEFLDYYFNGRLEAYMGLGYE